MKKPRSKEASMVFYKQRIERLVHKQIDCGVSDSDVRDSGVDVREDDEAFAAKRQRVSTPTD